MTSNRTAARRLTALALTTASLAAAGGLALAPAAHAGSPEGKNRGYQIACSAKVDGKPVQVTLHDDDFADTYVVVSTGRGARRTTGYRDAKNIVSGTRVRASARTGGDLATVTGTVRKVGEARQVHRSTTDQFGTYVTTGTRTRVATRLKVTIDGASAPLTCGSAYAFDTETTKKA